MNPHFQFLILEEDSHSRARTGILNTPHGIVQTPVFMPVGTAATVKATTSQDLRDKIQAQIVLANTYHLYLRPGCDILREAGGIHAFMNWHGPVLTDSGGYQVYSLAQNRKITDEGVIFQSHIDGSKHLFTPEKVIDIQKIIGADILMAFDECPPYPCSYDYASRSLELTHKWALRCLEKMSETEGLYGYDQCIFPIVQGSTYKNLREKSARFLSDLNTPGIAIGGLAVGEPTDMMYDILEFLAPILPHEKPRYLMGVGTPENILEAIARGIDMFDCVIPTRNARHGMLFTWDGIIQVKNQKWKTCFELLNTQLFGEGGYSFAYLHHLFKAGEILALTIATLHNLNFYQELMNKAREQIVQKNFDAWKNSIIPKLKSRI